MGRPGEKGRQFALKPPRHVQAISATDSKDMPGRLNITFNSHYM